MKFSGFFHSLRRLSQLELALVFSRATWVAAAGVVICIPTIYLIIYLSSLWDPISHTKSLKVGLVNLDQGYAYREQMAEMGQDLTNALMLKAEFGYVPMANADLARQRVRSALETRSPRRGGTP